jgi:hypothetical protein
VVQVEGTAYARVTISVSEDEMVQVLRCGLSILLKHHGYMIGPGLMLAFGGGANATISSPVNGVASFQSREI